MYYYLVYDNEGNPKEYTKSIRRIMAKEFTEVDEETYKQALKGFGFDYKTTEDEINDLKKKKAESEEVLELAEYTTDLDYRLLNIELNL